MREQGDADAFFVGRSFVTQAVLSKVVAVVSREEDEGVLQNPLRRERIEDSADVVINPA